jgi:cytochrome c biogenesis protein CcmG/thiol:disulfide interchange protein DsbE
LGVWSRLKKAHKNEEISPMSHMRSRNHNRQQQDKKEQQIRLMTYGSIGLLFLGLMGLLWVSLQPDVEPETAVTTGSAQMGQLAPDFSLPTLGGGETNLSDYAGQVVLVNFWATWCPPCKAEMPDINAYYEARQDDGLVVLAVNAQEDTATVSSFIEATGFSFPVLLDSDGRVEQQYQVRSFPMTFVIDRDGRVVYIHNGLISPDVLTAVLDPLLS